MRALFRIVSIIVLLLVVVFAAGTYWIMQRFDPNNYKDLIEKTVQEKLDRQIRIDGNMNWSFFPNVGLTIPNTLLSETGGFREGTAVTWQQATVAVELFPLLYKQIVIKEIHLNGVKLADLSHLFTVDIQGEATWQDTSVDMPSVRLKVGGLGGDIVLRSSAVLDTQNQKLILKDIQLTIPKFQQDSGKDAFTLQSLVWGGDGTIDLSAPKTGTVLKGKGTMSSVRASGLHLTDIKFDTNMQQGKLSVMPISAKLYNGTYQGSLFVNVASQPMRWQNQQTAKNVQLELLFNDVAPSVRLSGVGHITSNISASGFDKETILPSSRGTITLNVVNGVWQNFDLDHWWKVGTAVFNGQPLPSESATPKTVFSQFDGIFYLQNGIAQNNDLSVISDLLNINGKGRINLRDSTVDYRFVITSPRSQNSLQVPLDVAGTFKHFIIVPDVAAILKQVAKKEVTRFKKDIVNKIKKEAGDHLGQQLQSGLNQLLGQ